MKMRFIVAVGLMAVIAISVLGFKLCMPPKTVVSSPTEDIQYPFDKAGGLITLRIGEDVLLGVDMITGKMMPDGFSEDGFTGSLNLEMPTPKPGFKIRIDGIRLIESTSEGKGRIFVPNHVQVDVLGKPADPRMEYLIGMGQFPVLWKSGERGVLYFEFPDLPRDLFKADLVITYSGSFPGKKHASFYENYLPVTRKSYSRSRA